MHTDILVGFDDYLYIVRTLDENGTISEYEYGNKKCIFPLC